MQRKANYRRACFYKAGTALVAAVAVTTGAGSVLAQSASPPAEEQETEATNEIVVTALRRDQRLQDAPVAVTAIAGDALERLGSSKMEDVALLVPGMTFTVANGSVLTAIRGIAPDATTPVVDPSLAQHVDGVYQPRTYNMALQLADVESVEVLRGPQGTLYGRNATAGVINYALRGPTDEIEASITTAVGNYDRFMVKGAISGPIAEGIGFRIAGLLDQRSGYGRNPTLGLDVDDENVKGIRGVLRLEPASDLTIDVSGSISTNDFRNQFYSFTTIGGANCVGPIEPLCLIPPQERVSLADVLPRTQTRQATATAVISYEPADGVRIKSISGYIDSTYDSVYDSEGSAAPLTIAFLDLQSRQYTQELSLNLQPVDWVDAVIGAFYLDEHFETEGPLDFPNGLRPITTAPIRQSLALDQDTVSKAIFGDATFNLTDSLRLLTGIRYTRDKKRGRQLNSFGGVVNCTATPEVEYSSTTGKIGAQYEWSSNVMTYVTYQTGFKAGGFNYAACNDAFEPEKVKSYEAGFKSTLLDGDLTFNVTAYRYDYRDLQVTVLVPPAAILVENAAQVRGEGLEIESVARPTRDLRFDLAVSLLDARYRNFETIDQMTRELVNLDGETITRAPKYTISLGAEYSFVPIADYSLTARGEVYHSDKIFYTPFHEPISSQLEPFTILNAYLTLRPDHDEFRVMAFVRNLTDETYRTGGFNSTTFRSGRGSYNAPRTYGLEVGYNF